MAAGPPLATEPIGEVIESSTRQMVFECWEGREPAPVGSLIQAVWGDFRVIGVVISVRQVSRDPLREPIAFGHLPDELLTQQPQLPLLLSIQGTALCLGQGKGSSPLTAQIPEKPAPLHSTVSLLPKAEVCSFSRQWAFLQILFLHRPELFDHLLLSLCRWSYEANDRDPRYLTDFGKALTPLLRRDYPRLRLLLRQLEDLVP
ncbi:MAG: hypothetical protein NZ959_12355 [Armatimonadetes bacterium]|nr:hypothetical protein [Armatimonadota bacterium]MDW8123117.1 hypothetical protein [Armatimonadota bacterium]